MRRAAPALLALMLSGCATAGLPISQLRGAAPTMLHADCRGRATGTPTVILESGAFGSSADWDSILDDLSQGGRVCAYDRSGIGQSPDRTGPRDATAIARELRGLLDQIGERRPVVLVGHSNGALYVETFAALYPNRTAGLVYVQGVMSDDLDFPLLIEDLDKERGLAGLAAFTGQIGLAPAISQILTGATGLSGEAAQRKKDALEQPGTLNVAADEDRAMVPSLTTTRKLGGPVPRIPVAVVFGATDPEAPLSAAWKASNLAAAKKARTSWVLEIPNASHTSPLVRDRTYVEAAVNWLRAPR